MALRLRELALTLDESEDLLSDKLADRLNIPYEWIRSWKIVRMGIDARKKPRVLRVYTMEFCCENEELVLERNRGDRNLEIASPAETPCFPAPNSDARVLIVGMGPAGLFAALTLCDAGLPVVLIERGRPVEERLQDVRSFWAGGDLKYDSNIQFGEGGAGTFSDGKLTSRMNHPLIRHVLQRLVDFGAPEDIIWQAKPHIGSDRLRNVLIRIRAYLLEQGVDIRFSSCLTDLDISSGKIRGGIINDRDLVLCDTMILASGHSARSTYEMLRTQQVALEQKPFAIGLRIEHPLELINQIQYGMASHPLLPSADYRLAWNDPQTRRGVYSFCMCPGGVVVNASSEPGALVVNGMSDFSRNAPRSNSALVVSVATDDFPDRDLCAGIEFQRTWERAAFMAGVEGWRAPAQPLMSFLGRKGGRLSSSCLPSVVEADLENCLPDFATRALRRALPEFDRKMRGFICEEATLVGVETRTSSPLRILRDSRGESLSHKGLFPAGEGAGYAGGIMSAAVDGIKIATTILQTSQ